jgi:hypothetical protein
MVLDVAEASVQRNLSVSAEMRVAL